MSLSKEKSYDIIFIIYGKSTMLIELKYFEVVKLDRYVDIQQNRLIN